MIGQNKITYLNSLLNKKFRKEYGVFRAEGNKIALELLNSTLIVNEVYASEKWLKENEKFIKKTEVYSVSESVLKKLSILQSPSEVLIVAKIPDYQFDINEISSNYCLCYDFLQDPGNLGTIIRTADWFGIRNIICSKGSVDAFSPKVVQASMGSIAAVKIFYEDLEIVLKDCKNPIYGTFMEGESLKSTKIKKNAIIVFGNEGKGISKEISGIITNKINIKGASDSIAESLNVAISSGIICSSLNS
ncbi:MAG: RNA methyltransferase [Bacteroidales bacterium]|nr:RNA methyltransferase [Bacteroidales bacterium]